MTKIEVGDAVIINECDRPCTAHVAIVTEIDQSGAVTARYLNAKLASRQKDGKTVPRVVTDSSQFEATKLVDFGVALFTDPRLGCFRCVQGFRIPVVSKYSRDERTRPWQELGTDCDEFGWCEGSEEVMQLWKGHV